MSMSKLSLFLFRTKSYPLLVLTVVLAMQSALLFADAMFEEVVLFEDTNGACAIAAADFNMDTHPDFVYTCNPLGHIKWMENDGAMNFTEHMVIEGFTNAKSIDTGDIDRDGYPDFVATAYGADKISWFHNNGDGSFTERVVCDTWDRPGWALVGDHVQNLPVDINSDGEVDILATSCEEGILGWFENDGEENFTEHIIKDSWTKVSCANAVDMDGDGDTDILAAAQTAGIVWFENDGNEVFTEHFIFGDWDRPNWICAGDINGDGNMDFAATACGNSDAIGWFENDGEEEFTFHLLRSQYNGARCPLLSDIDGDGDMDIFGIAWVSGLGTFFDNNGNAEFTEYTISDDAVDMLKYFVVDLDEDGDLDLLASTAVYEPHHIRWFKNLDSFIDGDFANNVSSGHYPLEVGFSYDAYAHPAVNSWQWDFNNDGTTDSTDPNPTFEYQSPGTYDVRLDVSNGIDTDTIIKEGLIRVFDGESSIEFDSNNSSINVPAESGLELGEEFTLEACFHAYDYGMNPALGNGMIFYKGSISAYLNNAYPLYNQMTLIVKMTHQDETQSVVAMPAFGIFTDTGYHLAITYDGDSNLKVYLNGVEQSLTVYTAPSGPLQDNSNQALTFGNNGTNTSAFKGYLDELRVWNVVRTPDEINANMADYLNGDEIGLNGYWKCNDGSGDTLVDATSNRYDAAVVYCHWHQGDPFSFHAVDGEEIVQPEAISLRNYPNPFNPETTITFELSAVQNDNITLGIYNLKGQMVRLFSVAPDCRSVVWNGRNDAGKSVSSGLYFARLNAGDESAVRKMLLMK